MLFPLELGHPSRAIMWNQDEFLKLVNFYNGVANVFRSIYSFPKLSLHEKLDYEKHSLIDRLFFDFDGARAYDDMVTLHNWLQEKSLKHIVLFSGMKGFHIHLFTDKVSRTESKKELVGSNQEEIINQTDIVVDQAVIGNIAQMCRVPNTIHLKAKNICTFLTEEEIQSGFKNIKETTMQKRPVIFGKENYILDKTKKRKHKIFIPDDLELYNSETTAEIDLPYCMKSVLKSKQGNLCWKQRFVVIIYLRELGFSLQQVISFLKANLSPEKFYHCMVEERNQPSYLYKRQDIFFPSQQTLIEFGFPCGKHCKHPELYKMMI